MREISTRQGLASMLSAGGLLCASLGLLIAIAPVRLAAQGTAGMSVAHEVFVDSEAERYLRVLQLSGSVPLHPWSLRGFSGRELRRLVPTDTLHPWHRHYDFARDSTAGPHFSLVRPSVGAVYNTGFPFGGNDGAVWAGRGLTTVARVGAAVRFGPLSLVLAPTLFRAENQDFDLESNGWDGPQAFGDLRYARTIDRPRRFGSDAYARLDPGQSTLRIDLPGVTAGVSTANQFWGPAGELPLMLGSNAGGFPHAFLGTSSPLPIGIGRLHARLSWGQLSQSAYAPADSGETRRLMSGLVVVFVPWGMDGLEVGLSRAYHAHWPEGGPDWDQIRRPLEPFLKVNAPESNARGENQLAAVFGRWVFPRGGVEVYGEYARDDHSWDNRDLILEPDHSASYLVGMRKVWEDHDSHRSVVAHLEWVNARRSNLLSVRNQARFYTHTQLTQGHTQRGQLLGSEAAFAGSGATAGVDLYNRRGRWSFDWSMVGPQEVNSRSSGAPGVTPGTIHSLGIESLRFWHGSELTGGLDLVADLDPLGEEDRFSARARVGVTAAWPRR